jgi:cytochrome c oxidase assembly protein subunit 15
MLFYTNIISDIHGNAQLEMQQTPVFPLPSAQRGIALWFACCALLVAMMIVIGGLTRLTESGLSIVEWKPLSGTLPPLSDADFARAFDAYKASPQYRKMFSGMTLAEFRHIFWLEYLHRLWGRLIGLAFCLPYLFFLLKRRLSARASLTFGAIFLLIAAQGGIGWYMVKSGLVSDPHVSAYRLTLHLGMGFLLFALLLWQFLTYSHPVAPFFPVAPAFPVAPVFPSAVAFAPPSRPLKGLACAATALLCLQLLLGASVAGQHAGFVYNSFPTMDGQWIPEGVWPNDVWYRNVFEDVTTAQFLHRITAWLVAVAAILLWIFGRKSPHIAHLLPILFSILVVQFLLGVLTLLFVVPVPLASLHQANAILLLALYVTVLHRLFLPLAALAPEQS